MKKAIIFRGAPGAGKSTFLKQHPILQGFGIGLDTVRTLMEGASYQSYGLLGISQSNPDKVYALYDDCLSKRIEKGEFLVLDNTHAVIKNFNQSYQRLTNAGYEVLVIDFSNVPDDIIHARNSSRPEFQQLPINALESLLLELKTPISSNIPRIDHDAKNIDDVITAFLSVPVVNLDHYDRVIHIGDIQGCDTVLNNVLSNMDTKSFYILVGDWLDRGIENAKVLSRLIELADHENIAWIYGNHEKHLEKWANGEEAVAREFRLRTEPDLNAAGIDKNSVKKLLSKTNPVLLYQHGENKVIVSHAGVFGIPFKDSTNLAALIPNETYIRGGSYRDDVDSIFTNNMEDTGWMQVHGHRNSHKLPIIATPKSINLEGEVEFGGHLRVATLENNQWTPHYYENKIYTTWRQRVINKEIEIEKIPEPFWLNDANDANLTLSQEMWKSLNEHPGVYIKELPQYPHIVSINFQKEVFFSGQWDEITTKARGLFVNKNTLEVVSRSYDKFFNVGEMEDNTLSDLATSLTYPVSAYVKENGYLTTLGYDAHTDSLIFTSKSTTDGDFAQWFKDHLTSTMNDTELFELKQFLKEGEACMVFEMIDIDNDPHMIDYKKSHCVLLAVFHRTSHEEQLPFEQLKKIGKHFKMKVKERAMVFNDHQSLAGFVKKVYSNLAFRWKGEDLEGFVLEDAHGKKEKLKFPNYSMWKHLRGTKDFIYRHRIIVESSRQQNILFLPETPKNFDEWLEERLPHEVEGRTLESLRRQHENMCKPKQKINKALSQDVINSQKALENCGAREKHPLAIAFVEWVKDQPLEILEKDILSLRKKFNEEVGIQGKWLHEKYDFYNPDQSVGRSKVHKKNDIQTEAIDSSPSL